MKLMLKQYAYYLFISFFGLLPINSFAASTAKDLVVEQLADAEAARQADREGQKAAQKAIGYNPFFRIGKPKLEHATEIKNNPIYEKAYNDAFETTKEKEYAAFLPLYKKYEENISNPDVIKAYSQDPLAQVSGGISYAMTIDEMKEVAKQKFQALKTEGKIITPREFEAIKNNYHEVEPQHTDLTRVWGADYLKKRFAENNTQNFDVPDYVIVTENPNHLKIELNLANTENPRISALKNGHIYFQRIEGRPIANVVGHNIKFTGYADFATGGHDQQKNRNILEDSASGINYVVDTEIKSFSFDRNYHGVSPSYTMKRFILLNNIQGSGPYPIEIVLD